MGIEYSSQRVDLSEGEQISDAYRAIHPLGVVPSLETDEYPEKNLAPAIGTPYPRLRP